MSEPVVIPEQPVEVADLLQQYNKDIAALQLMVEGNVHVVDYTENGEAGYKLTLDNDWSVNVSASDEPDPDIPILGIDEAGYWVYLLKVLKPY